MSDCIELILNNARTNPDNPCVIQGDREISYKEFFDLVKRIAAFLKENNYTKVLINMQQGINSYAVIISVLMIGGHYCPLSLDSPIERKLYILDEFRPDIIIAQDDLALPTEKLQDHKQSLISEIITLAPINYNWEKLYTKSPGSIAYIIYTSGSTGNPKGVIIRRKSLNEFLKWSISEYKCSGNDRWAQYSYLSFDLSIVDIFTALCSGSTLIPYSDIGQKLRPANTIVRRGITVWHSVPGAVDFMIANEKTRPADLSTIRLMSFCGEPLYQYHLEYLFSKNPDMIIFNTYGPTEGTLFCTWVVLDKLNYKNYCDLNVCIGVAIPGWNLLLENFEDDPHLKEIVLYGGYLGNGYLNLESEAFASKEINGNSEEIFKTGDLVKSVNNNLYFVGRKDNQVKHRGHRIELDEIDNWIMKFTGARSVSLVYKDAIYSFVETKALDEAGARNFLENNIEKYKIPAYIYQIDSLPRNNNQKVDKIKLKKIIDEKGTADIAV